MIFLNLFYRGLDLEELLGLQDPRDSQEGMALMWVNPSPGFVENLEMDWTKHCWEISFDAIM